jgi:hypothetical protein
MKHYTKHVIPSMKPTRVIATLAGIQVIRSLWEVYDAIDNKRPGRCLLLCNRNYMD